MNAIDLTILNLYRINGQEWPLLPGLLAMNPPKKLARGRDQDRLLVYLTMAGNVSCSNSEYEQIAGQVAETFYDTAGSLTFALKTSAEALNNYLVERNMKSTGKGLYSTGSLVLCSLRGDSMYIVQCGPTHVYHLNATPTHLHNPQLAGKGLGLSQTAHMYFAHITVAPGDSLLMCAALPPNWDKSLSEEHGSAALDITRRRLLAITSSDVSALLVKVSEGSGAMNIIRSAKDIPMQPAQPALPAEGLPLPSLQPVPIQITPVLAEEKPNTVESMPDTVSAPGAEGETVITGQGNSEESSPVEEARDSESDLDEAVNDGQSVEVGAVNHAVIQAPVEANTQMPEADQPDPAAPEIPQPDPGTARQKASAWKPGVSIQPQTRTQVHNSVRAIARFLAVAIQRGRALKQKLAAWGEKNIPRLLPGDEEDQQSSLLARSWPLFIAIAVPVLLVVAATVVYYQLGFRAQYEIYYTRAGEVARMTVDEPNLTTQRTQWQATLGWLDRADRYQATISPESQKLRQRAQGALDAIDHVMRVDFTPAFDLSTYPKNLQVTRMVASDSDIYLLDNLTGVVYRGLYNNRNYSIDGTFKCRPGNFEGIRVDKLIDIVILPRSNPFSATVLGIDASGNLIYCIPGQEPKTSFLQIPDKGWKGITSIAYDTNNSLYVLDATGSAVWMYYGNAEFKFLEKPFFYFQDQVPVMMEQSIGMAINGDDLYLLHQDGHMTTCRFSRLDVSPTSCNDPALYIDTRPGYQGGIHLGDAIFAQISFTSLPDPSVALLEPNAQSIFRFGARSLELQTQVRAGTGKDNHLPKGVPLSAMAFSPNKVLFVFVNGQVFFAQNIP